MRHHLVIGFSGGCFFQAPGFIVFELVVPLSAMESTHVSVCHEAAAAELSLIKYEKADKAQVISKSIVDILLTR